MVEPTRTPSQAVEVTLFEDRARVVRRARARLPAGSVTLAVEGLSPYVDDPSLQAKVITGGADLVSALVKRRVSLPGEQGQADTDELERTRDRLRDAHQRLSAEEEALAVRSVRLEQSFAEWLGALAAVPGGWREGGAAEEWRRAHQALQAELGALDKKREALELERAHAARDREQAAESLSRARTRRPLIEARAELQLVLAEAGELELELSYRVPCALWRPEHLARLTLDPARPERGSVELLTWATVWQITGEEWRDVSLVFSTARPARAAEPPLIKDDVLISRKKSPEERRHLVVQVRDEVVHLTGAARGKRELEEMPGVDDGGAPLTFRAAAPLTVPSDGRPLRVEIARQRLESTVERALLPEVAAVAHLRATATYNGATPLLAGPVRVARDAGLVGRSRIGFVAPGEVFELGFGPDDGLRVRRRVEEKQERVPVLGTQKVARTVKLFLSNLSGEPRSLEVVERIPVSEVEEVEIVLGAHDGFTLSGEDGFLKQRLTLGKKETRQLELRYEVRAKANVVLPF